MKSIVALVSMYLLFVGCSSNEIAKNITPTQTQTEVNSGAVNEAIVTGTETKELQNLTVEAEPISLINPDGEILKERFTTPNGFVREESETGSFGEFLQSLPLKSNGSKVQYYDGREKNTNTYLAVVDYSLGDRDLQQCADAVMRLRAEYLYAIGQQEKITFNFVSGFAANFSKWRQGYGISVKGNDVSWTKNKNNNNSYESFQKYLDVVYAYSSTLSLEKELIPKSIEHIAIGDVFIVGGSPGHCVIVVDMALNEATNDKIFMLAQSYMPAQDIQILKGEKDGSPWYNAADLGDKLITPEWTFKKTQLRTWQ